MSHESSQSLTFSRFLEGMELIWTTCTANEPALIGAEQQQKAEKYFALVVLEDEDHVKVAQLELHALKVDTFDVAEREHERRLVTCSCFVRMV